jgi:hypothetical protein
LSKPTFAMAAHGGEELLLGCGDATGVLDELPAGSRGKGTLAQTINEPHAEAGFQLAHL